MHVGERHENMQREFDCICIRRSKKVSKFI
jgi:hypothetical protein